MLTIASIRSSFRSRTQKLVGGLSRSRISPRALLDQRTGTARLSGSGGYSAAAQIFACPALCHRRRHPVTLIGPSGELA